MLHSLITIIISLLAVCINAVTVVVNDPPSDTAPPCLSQCLRSYAEYAPAHGSNCEPSDNNCVCRDPLLAVYVACCMSDSCSDEAPVGAAYLDFQCKMSGVLLPDLTDCDGAKKAQEKGEVNTVAVTLYSTESDGRLRSVMLAGPSTSDGVVATTKDSTSSSAASNSKSSQPVSSTTSTANTSKTMTTSSSEVTTMNPTAPPSTAAAAGPTLKPSTSTESAPPPVINPASSSSAPPPTANPQSAKPLTLGLSIGLGVPLSIAAAGILSLLLYRRRKQQAFESDSFFMGGPYDSPSGQGQVETTRYATEWKPEMPGGSGGYAAQRAGVGRWEGGRFEMPT